MAALQARLLLKLFCLFFMCSLLPLLYWTRQECSCTEVQEGGQEAEPFLLPSNVTVASVNTTSLAAPHILVFNRVPKAGSSSINSLLGKLAARNNFRLVKDKVNQVEQITMGREEEGRLARTIALYREGSVYSKHVARVDFESFGLATPLHVNIVRRPVDRLVSWYYYIRAAWYIVERQRVFPSLPPPSLPWLKRSYDQCVATGQTECTYNQGDLGGFADHRRQTIFFCGHSPDCRPFNSATANRLAKRAVERSYAVVGVLEELNATLTVLQHYIPRYFRGAHETYWKTSSEVNRNIGKPSVSQVTLDIVAANLTEETDFYIWCRQRLLTQYHALLKEGRL